MTIKLDCKKLNKKPLFIARMQRIFPETYSLNYDSLIDGARGTNEEVTIEIINFDRYEDSENLKEVLAIIEKENPSVRFVLR